MLDNMDSRDSLREDEQVPEVDDILDFLEDDLEDDEDEEEIDEESCFDLDSIENDVENWFDYGEVGIQNPNQNVYLIPKEVKTEKFPFIVVHSIQNDFELEYLKSLCVDGDTPLYVQISNGVIEEEGSTSQGESVKVGDIKFGFETFLNILKRWNYDIVLYNMEDGEVTQTIVDEDFFNLMIFK